MLLRRFHALCFFAATFTAAPVLAIPDAAGDFLPTYTGPIAGDVDVLLAEVALIGSNFRLSATLNAPVGTTTGAAYAFGFNRGQGAALFQSGTPPIGSGVLFDSVVAILPNGTGSVTRIVGGGTDTIPAGNIAIAGNSFTATFPTSFLPGAGLAPSSYTWNLWPRVGLGQNVQVADFAPDNSNAAVVPEPVAIGLGPWVALLLLRRQVRAASSGRQC